MRVPSTTSTTSQNFSSLRRLPNWLRRTREWEVLWRKNNRKKKEDTYNVMVGDGAGTAGGVGRRVVGGDRLWQLDHYLHKLIETARVIWEYSHGGDRKI